MENIKNHFLPADCKRGNTHSLCCPAQLQNCWPNHIAYGKHLSRLSSPVLGCIYCKQRCICGEGGWTGALD